MGSPGRRIALLRGVNVGGHRKLPMADLRTLLADLGFTDAVTFIQSGNAVLSGGPAADIEAERSIAEGVTERFGFDVPVCVRSEAELRHALARSESLFPPGPDTKAHDKRVHIAFLSAAPERPRVDRLDPNRSPGDVVIVEGREAHLFYANGAGTSKLTGAHLEQVLGVSVTARNLATVRALIELAT